MVLGSRVPLSEQRIVRSKPKSDEPDDKKPAGIRDIARALDISIGSVDRALHNRPGISPLTRKRVLHMAKALGYRPNLAARFLSSRKPICIGVCVPKEVRSYWDNVREGILEGARPFELTGVRVIVRGYPRLGEGEMEALESILREDLQGLIIAPGDPEKMKAAIRRTARRGIPILTVTTDAPHTERLALVSTDSFTNGSIVGELMGRFLGGKGTVLFVTGMLLTEDHAQKFEGFQQGLRQVAPDVKILQIVEAHDNEAEAYEKCREVLGASSQVNGVYISTANSIPVLRAIDDLGLSDRVTVITTDLLPELVPLIQTGRVAATIHQRPREQGRIAFQTLYRFLTEDVCPPPRINLSPHIIMRGNLNLFLHELPAETEEIA